MQKKTWLLSGLSFVNIIFSVVITYPLVFFYDVTGAAGGMLVSAIIMGILYFVFANKYAPIFWNYSSMILTFFVLIIASVIVISIAASSIPYIFELILKLLILMAFSIYVYKTENLKLSLR